MIQYTGKYFEVKNCSAYDGQDVNVLEYKEDNPRKHKSFCYEYCTKCGKPLKNRYFVVQESETDIEIAYLGADCVKKLIAE